MRYLATTIHGAAISIELYNTLGYMAVRATNYEKLSINTDYIKKYFK